MGHRDNKELQQQPPPPPHNDDGGSYKRDNNKLEYYDKSRAGTYGILKSPMHNITSATRCAMRLRLWPKKFCRWPPQGCRKANRRAVARQIAGVEPSSTSAMRWAIHCSICAHMSNLVMRKYMHASAVLYFAATRVHFLHRSRESHIARWEKSFPLSLIASQKWYCASGWRGIAGNSVLWSYILG